VQRARHALRALRPNADLARSADRHYFDHTSPSGETPLARIRASTYLPRHRAYLVGENIARATMGLATSAGIVGRRPHQYAAGQHGATYTQQFGVSAHDRQPAALSARGTGRRTPGADERRRTRRALDQRSPRRIGGRPPRASRLRGFVRPRDRRTLVPMPEQRDRRADERDDAASKRDMEAAVRDGLADSETDVAARKIARADREASAEDRRDAAADRDAAAEARNASRRSSE
jgi:hypothetical protein